MEGLIAKFIILFAWGAFVGGILGFVCGSLLATAKYRDFTARICATCQHCNHSDPVYTSDGKVSLEFMTCRLGRGSNCRTGSDKLYSLVTEKSFCDKWEERTGDTDGHQQS